MSTLSCNCVKRTLTNYRSRSAVFIPACAGNTAPKARWRTRSTVHPRVCGEHDQVFSDIAAPRGSSPRVRGTHTGTGYGNCLGRFIPACAGNTPSDCANARSASVHPRVCGEHVRWVERVIGSDGSSPRVRGTHDRVQHDAAPVRFIPACAGNTHSAVRENPDQPVHPRVCGEHISSSSDDRVVGGSSPRVRGTLQATACRIIKHRFIPACAGNTPAAAHERVSESVHPRVCGEHAAVGGRAAQNYGSSPRVRGTRDLAARFRPADRFIPACAGNTGEYRYFSPVFSVHPRVCGEHVNATQNLSPPFGSSPRVRGTRDSAPASSGTRRFIPACAGNTACICAS